MNLNRRIGMAGTAVAGISAACFAVFLLAGFDFGSYLVCIFLALGYLMTAAGIHSGCRRERSAAGALSVALAGIYAAIILTVYFAQLTAVRLDALGETALRILDYKRLGLFFSLDLLGYGMLSLSMLFAGLALNVKSKRDKALRTLLIIHGIFFISCFVVPMLGVFSPDMQGGETAGVILLEIWCACFLPVTALAFRHFREQKK